MYTPVDVNVKGTEKLRTAVTNRTPASVSITLDGTGGHTLLLTQGQKDKIDRSKLIGKRKLTIRMSRKQVQANVEHSGGFLGMLAGLATKALPVILGGLTTGLVSGAVEKAVAGSGLYLHKSGHCVKVEPVQGNGLYLTPHRALPGRGDGLYLKRGGTIVDGRGLILGKNSPFKNIPILNLLL